MADQLNKDGSPRQVEAEALPIARKDGLLEVDHLTRGGIGAALWKLSAPVVVAQLMFTTLTIVDQIWIGQTRSTVAISAVFQANRVLMIQDMMLIGLVTGCSALVSRAIGQRDTARANEALAQTVLFVLGVWALMAATGWMYARPLFELLQADAPVAEAAATYLVILLNFGGLLGFNFALSAVQQAAGDTRTPLLMALIATVSNAVLDPLLIFTAGWGVAGAAWATVLARLLSVGFAFGMLFCRGGVLRLQWHMFRLKPHTIWRIVSIGLPATIQLSVFSTGEMFVLAFVNPYGSSAAAGYGICQRLQMLPMIPGLGLGRAAGVLIGQNLGAGQPRRAVISTWMAAGIFAAVMAATGLLYLAFSRPLIGLFMPDTTPEFGQVFAAGNAYLQFMVAAYVPMALGMLFNQALRGAADTISPLVLTFVAVAVMLLSTWQLGRPEVMGLTGVWLGLVIGSFVRGGLMTTWFILGKWKTARAW